MAKRPNKRQQESEEKAPLIALRWSNTEGLPTVYANEMFITHMGNEFFIVFGELSPIPPDAFKRNLPEYIEIKPVAKIAVTPENMLKFAEAIQENVNKSKGKSIFPNSEEE